MWWGKVREREAELFMCCGKITEEVKAVRNTLLWVARLTAGSMVTSELRLLPRIVSQSMVLS